MIQTIFKSKNYPLLTDMDAKVENQTEDVDELEPLAAERDETLEKLLEEAVAILKRK